MIKLKSQANLKLHLCCFVVLVLLLGLAAPVAPVAGGVAMAAEKLSESAASLLRPGYITTVAGNGEIGYTGDGGPATEAGLNYIYGTASDLVGNLYIADRNSNVIRKVNRQGIISTVAGSGQAGYNGDNMVATESQLFAPYGVVADLFGNIYFADSGNHRVRKVDGNGVITTVAGTGTFATGGGFSGDGGAAVEAQLKNPRGIALDLDGNIYFCDTGNYRVRKIDCNGVITTVAGNGTPGSAAAIPDQTPALNANLTPNGLAVGIDGSIYLTSYHRVLKVNPAGQISTVAGTGVGGYSGDGAAAVSAQLKNPLDVAVDLLGNLYIADYSNQRVRKVNSGGIISTVAGDGTMANTGDGGPAVNAQLLNPTNVSMNLLGNLYIGTQTQVRKVGFYIPAIPQSSGEEQQSAEALLVQ